MSKSRQSGIAKRRALAELSRRAATSAPSAFLIEARQIVAHLDQSDVDITARLSVPEIVALGRAAKKKGRRGRPAKLDLREAARLRSGGLSFPTIAQRLDPAGWAKSPRKAAENI